MKPSVQAHLAQLRRDWRMWNSADPAILHIDYCLAPGTPEGDAATAYRKERLAEIEAEAKAVQALGDAFPETEVIATSK